MNRPTPVDSGMQAWLAAGARPFRVLMAITATLSGLSPMSAVAQAVAPVEAPVRPYIDLEINKTTLPEPKSELALGVSLASSPEYSGSGRQGLSLKPLFAWRYGRFKLSSSGGSGVLNFGRIADDSGASARLVNFDQFKLKASLRLSSGRDSADSVDLAGLPDVRKTVIARVLGSYQFDRNWHSDAVVGFDLLGRGNGAFVTTGVGYSQRLTPDTEFTIGGSLTWGNRTHLNSLYGVPAYAVTDERPAYSPGSGLKDAAFGFGLTTQLAPRWILFGGIGYNYLLGPAAESPLTTGRGGVNANIGIGWRCCR